MKNSLKLSLWLLSALFVVQMPSSIVAQQQETEKQRAFKGAFRNLREARAMLKAKEKAKAPKEELERYKQKMRQARRKMIALYGAALVATIIAAFLARTVYKGVKKAQQEEREKEAAISAEMARKREEALADPQRKTVMKEFWGEVEPQVKKYKDDIRKEIIGYIQSGGYDEVFFVYGSNEAVDLMRDFKQIADRYAASHPDRFKLWFDEDRRTGKTLISYLEDDKEIPNHLIQPIKDELEAISFLGKYVQGFGEQKWSLGRFDKSAINYQMSAQVEVERMKDKYKK